VTANARVLLLGAVLTLAGGAAARAQSVGNELAGADQATDNFRRDRNVSVLERPHPGYEALGVNLGGFMLWPKVTALTEYNDNVFATGLDQVDDVVFQVKPQLTLTSDWPRHWFQAHASGTINRFASETDQNSNDYSFGADGRLDILRTAHLTGGLDVSRLTEPRTSAGTEGQPAPVQYRQTTVYVSGDRTFNRLKLSGRLQWTKYDYLEIAGNFPQQDQDRQVTVVTGRADYAVTPDTAVFVEITGNDRNYRLSSSPLVDGAPVFPGFVNRDAKGVGGLVGANFDIAALVRGEIGVGYQRQDYKDDVFHDYSGLGARAKVEWFPTQLTTVTATATRSVEDAALAGASSYLSTNLGLRVDHELLRNLIVSATGTFGDDDYRGIDRQDKRVGAGLSASYLMNRRVGLTVAYNHFKNDSTGRDVAPAFAHYSVDRVGLTVTVQY
jgi:hypothetical protein